MAMHGRARTVVRTKDGKSTEYEIKVEVHQGSVLSPLLFMTVMEVLSQNGLPWELLHAYDLVLIAKNSDELKEKMKMEKECMDTIESDIDCDNLTQSLTGPLSPVGL